MQRPTCGSTGNISNCQDDPTHLPTHFPGSRESGNRAAGAIVMHAPLQPELLAVIELIIKQRCPDLGAFQVGRVLPLAQRRITAPSISFDRMVPKLMEPALPHEPHVRPPPPIVLP